MTTNTLPDTTMRNGNIGDLVELLKRQKDVKYDVVVTANKLRYNGGTLHVEGGAMRIDDDGVTDADAMLAPTDIFEGGLASRLDIPRHYLRRMRDEAIASSDSLRQHALADLLDHNVNTWLADEPSRKFLVRGFRTDDADEIGIARAILSDRFAMYDNLDVLMATLAGVNETGVETQVVSASLTERQMRVCIAAPGITALAPTLLGNYRSPYRVTPNDGGQGNVTDAGGRELPIVFGGFVVSNSETGGGAFMITPRVVVKVCNNGMTITKDQMRAVHLGGVMEEGVISWSADTQRKILEVVTAKARDAVSAFLDEGYVARVVDTIEQTSSTPVEDAAGTIERVGKVHAFNDAEQAAILDCFIKSGDLTAGGVMQAVTAAAQRVDDADRQAEMEDLALDVLATAAA